MVFNIWLLSSIFVVPQPRYSPDLPCHGQSKDYVTSYQSTKRTFQKKVSIFLSVETLGIGLRDLGPLFIETTSIATYTRICCECAYLYEHKLIVYYVIP